MKKLGIMFLKIFIFIGSGFLYVHFKKFFLKNNVVEYLTTEKNIDEDDIVSIEPFISN